MPKDRIKVLAASLAAGALIAFGGVVGSSTGVQAHSNQHSNPSSHQEALLPPPHGPYCYTTPSGDKECNTV